MDSFLPYFGLLLVAVVTYGAYKKIIGNNSSTGNKIPEPSGRLPIIGHLHLLREELHPVRILAKVSDELGPIFSLRLGSHRTLIVSNREMVKECLGTNDANFASRPDAALGKYMFYDNAGFGGSKYGAYWREIRKLTTIELFTKQSLDKQNDIRDSELKNSINKLYLKTKDRTSPLVINEWIEDYVFNVNIRVLFGKRATSDHQENMRAIKVFKKVLHLMATSVVSDFVPCLERMDIGGHLKEMKKVWKEIDGLIGKWLDEHAEKRREHGHENERGDFMDAMLDTLSNYDGRFGYGRETIIKATTQVILMTGSESTYETVIWALSLLLNSPHALKAAYNEIDMNVGREKWVEESDIKDLPYLQAIIKETLRMYPAGALAAAHEAMDDCTVTGYHIPKGTRVMVNIWKVHRDPKVYSNPDEFRPERFLGEQSELNYQGTNYEYIPFSSGRRMCPGNIYALRIIHITLARILQGFDVSTPMGKPVDMTECSISISFPKKKPLEMILTPRLSPQLYQN